MLSVRILHLVAMAVAVGGAALTWGLFRRSGDTAASSIEADAAVDLAAGYERLFWLAMGVLVMTGVGNLGSLAPFVPQADTEWGVVFTIKLFAVMAVLVLSVVRTLVVQQCNRAATIPESGRRTLRLSYAATALALAGIVALAGVLAHG
ncbi:CopD family protein [Halorussus litoreus]|uniref:CopD family protein n=1 Tax=Halorussus litoreus TaxID=1710536 RepID=UPI001E4A270F|nr:CopD family protein [Halorussus litoreus]